MTPDIQRAFDAANRAQRDGDAGEAMRLWCELIVAVPDLVEAHVNLGLLQEGAGCLDDAERSFRTAIVLQPECVQAHLNLGALCLSQKRFAAAQAAFERALAIDQRSSLAWSNLGVLCACTKQETRAEACYQTALALDPECRSARFNLAYLQLRQGRYAEGWQSLEARDWYCALDAQLGLPRWQGEDLVGKSMLIGFEAGHGDMIQFCRYAQTLKSAGAGWLTVMCHPALKRVMATMPGLDEALAYTEYTPQRVWDYWTPPLSLPLYCQTRAESIPAAIPYLKAPEVVPEALRLPDAGTHRLTVGLAWRGNPRFENDADRSLPALATLAPVLAVDGVRFVSLQKGAGEEEAAAAAQAATLLDMGPLIADFADTASVMSQLDLLISVDTAVAHLAGALGVPCWVMLPDYKTDWRWLADREDSPWYPGVLRLFRQPAMGDWATVVVRLKAALQALVEAA